MRADVGHLRVLSPMASSIVPDFDPQDAGDDLVVAAPTPRLCGRIGALPGSSPHARPSRGPGVTTRVLMALALLVGISAATPALAAEDPRMAAPKGLFISFKVDPADRPALRRAMASDGVAKLNALEARGRLAHYRLLWSRYADEFGWDMALVLDFPASSGIGGWKEVEDEATGGLPASALKMIKSVDSAPMDIERSERGASSGTPVYLVVPYRYLIGIDDYVKYVDGYVVPQMRGWMQERALSGYDVVLSRYPAGRPWGAMLLLAYDGDAGLGRRDAVVHDVRAKLASDPAWKAYADTKLKIRDELVPVVADVLAQR